MLIGKEGGADDGETRESRYGNGPHRVLQRYADVRPSDEPRQTQP